MTATLDRVPYAVTGGGRDVYVGFTLTGRRVQRYRRGGSGDAPADRPPPQ
jgi:hypothetical protein